MQEINNDFLANTRDIDPAVVIPGPRLTDPDPAGIRISILTITIPQETDLDPPVLIGPDCFTFRPDNQRGLRPVSNRFTDSLRRTIDFCGRLYHKAGADTEVITVRLLVDFRRPQLV